jgi:hypothetical protein
MSWKKHPGKAQGHGDEDHDPGDHQILAQIERDCGQNGDLSP